MFAKCPLCASNVSEAGEVEASKTQAPVFGIVTRSVPEVISQDMVLDHHAGITWGGYLLKMQIPETHFRLLNQNL